MNLKELFLTNNRLTSLCELSHLGGSIEELKLFGNDLVCGICHKWLIELKSRIGSKLILPVLCNVNGPNRCKAWDKLNMTQMDGKEPRTDNCVCTCVGWLN